MKMPIERRYNVGDAEMLASGRQFHQRVVRYITQFTALNPSLFPENYPDTVMTTITDSELVLSDMVYKDMVSKETADVTTVMKECVEEMRFCSYYAEQVCGGKNERYNQYGYNDLDSARRSADKLQLVMRDFNGMLSRCKDELIAAGLPETRINRAQHLQLDLVREETEQENMKVERKLAKLDRVEGLNRIWDHMVEINRAAEHLFYDQPEIRELFNLPHNSSESVE